MTRAPGISVAWRGTTASSLGEEGRGARRISRANRFSSGDGTERRAIGDPGGVVIGVAGPWLQLLINQKFEETAQHQCQ